jgi:hypothetical protein
MLDRTQLDAFAVCPLALELVSEAIAREYCVLPVSIDDGILHLLVASSNVDLVSVDATEFKRLQAALGRNFTFDIAPQVELTSYIDLHYMAAYSEIRNCDMEFQIRCPKRWADLLPMGVTSVRYCSECKKNVYFCRSIEELMLRSTQNQCVAFFDADTQIGSMGLPMEIPDP